MRQSANESVENDGLAASDFQEDRNLIVAMIVDMEATSMVADMRELYPIYPEYWSLGRRRLTADVAAAAQGLLEGGASQVLVISHHGAGEADWPNIVEGDLPDGARSSDLGKRALRDHADAAFHVGAHARGGSASFHSHTILPGLRLRAGGEPLAESHWWAWTTDLPLLGIVGSQALGTELGSLEGTPFFAVQGGADRARPRPRFRSPDDAAVAIRTFAREAINARQTGRAPRPTAVVLEASLQNGADAEAAALMEAAGWVRTSDTEFRIQDRTWRSADDRLDAAVWAASDAAWLPYSWVLAGMDPTTEASGLGWDRSAFERTDALLHTWTAERMVDWYAPGAARHLEGMPGT